MCFIFIYFYFWGSHILKPNQIESDLSKMDLSSPCEQPYRITNVES